MEHERIVSARAAMMAAYTSAAAIVLQFPGISSRFREQIAARIIEARDSALSQFDQALDAISGVPESGTEGHHEQIKGGEPEV